MKSYCRCLLSLVAFITAILFSSLCIVVAAHADADGPPPHHQCDHDRMKDLPGYGVNAPKVDVKYEYHNGDLAAYERHHKNKNTKNLRTADVLVVNTGATLGNMRFKAFFDQGPCPGGTCGYCASAGQSVQTFEGGTVTCTADDVLTTTKKNYIMDTLMPRAMDFLKNALRINPVAGNLNVGSGTCGSPGTPIWTTHGASGVPDADFAIYVTAAPKADPNTLTVAWALKCRVDGAGRPVAAHVNFVPKRLDNAAKGDFIKTQADVLTAIHEICHALGFSSPFFGGSPFTYYDLAYSTQSGGVTTVASAAPFNKARDFITSIRVVNEVKAHFGCTTATGAEIEDQGGAGTQGSHFEKRVFQQNAMAGISSTVAAMPSRILLAFFEDTGHYVANYSALDNYYITHGRGKGCAFLDQKCDSATNKASGEFCFFKDSTKSVCTHDGLAIGYCGATTFSTAITDTNMRYFTDPKMGSSIQLDDFCPSALHYSNLRCTSPTSSVQSGGTGDTFSADSRCFQSNLAKSSSSLLGGSSGGSGSKTVDNSARCYRVVCNADGSMGVVVDLKILPCPADGSAGRATLTGLSGYSGEIQCPEAKRFCNPNKQLPDLTPWPASVYAPAYDTPVPASCQKRQTSCAVNKLSLLPRCREFAFEVQRCFGNDCDGHMANWLQSLFGAKGNCSHGRTSFTAFCQEGRIGVRDVCALAGAGMISTMSAVAALLLVMILL